MLKILLKNNLYALSLYSGQIAGTIVIFVIARYLSVYDYGLFSSYKALALFWLLFANLGYNEYILVSSQNVVREVRLKIAFFILNAILVLSIIAGISTLMPLESNLLFILVLLRTFFDGVFFSIALPYFQASKKFNIISYVNIFYSITMVIIAIISYVFNLSLVNFLLLNICLGIFNFIQVSFYAKINYFIALRHIKELIKRLDKSIFAYIGVLICSYLYAQIPSLYSSTFIPKEDAALYFAAFTIASVISLLITAQVQKIVPEMIKSSIENIENIIKKELAFIITINCIIFMFFIFTGKLILKLLYGQIYYQNAYFILLILTFSNISIAIAGIYGAYITASGNQKVKIKMQFEAIIISILTLSVFHKLGIYAATLAYLLSASHIGVRYVLKTKQLLKYK